MAHDSSIYFSIYFPLQADRTQHMKLILLDIVSVTPPVSAVMRCKRAPSRSEQRGRLTGFKYT